MGTILVRECRHQFGEIIVASMLPGGKELSPAHKQPVLYKKVVLLQDVPQENLCKGDRALYIHELPGVDGGDDGAILELYDSARAEWRLATVSL